MNARLLSISLAMACSAACGTQTQQATTCSSLPPPQTKHSLSLYTVGFSQIGQAGGNPFKAAETASMQAQAAALGVQMVLRDAAGSTTQQQQDIQDLTALGVDALFVAPVDQSAVVPQVLAARKACIPAFMVDRDLDHSLATPGTDYVTFLGSNFFQEGYNAGTWLLNNNPNQLIVLELRGVLNSTPTIGRETGFAGVLAGEPSSRFVPVAKADGEFSRATAKSLVPSYLASNPNINVIYAHNDEMALGALDAIQDPNNAALVNNLVGGPIWLLSMDGETEAIQDIAAGDNLIASGHQGAGKVRYALSITTSPRFGPLALGTWQQYLAGQKIPAWTVVTDISIDSTNATDPAVQALGF